MQTDQKRLLSLRDRIEDALGAWARWVARAKIGITVGLLAVTVWLASYVPTMEVKMASEDFLFEDDPVRARYDAFKREFGQDQIATLAILPPEIFDLAFLEKLEAFHEDLESEVPYLEEVTSLVNVRSTYGRGDELVVEDLLDDRPTDAASLAAFKARALATPFYFKSGVLSDDGLATSVRVEVAVYGTETGSEEGSGEDAAGGGASDDELGGFEDDFAEAETFAGAEATEAGAGGDTKQPFLTGAQNARLIQAIHDVIARYDAPDFPIRPAGGTMMTYEFTKQLGRDVPLFFGGGLVVIGLLLMLLFRRFSTALLCLAVVVPATAATFGLAAFFRIPFSAPAQLIPSFLLAIGVSYSVHLVTIFLQDLGDTGNATASLEHALRHSGLPIMMTALTTSAGFLSFLAAEMKPIQEMGMISSIGVAVMLFYSMVLLPALLVLLPLSGRAATGSRPVDRVLVGLARLSVEHPWKIVAVTMLGVVAALVSMTRLYSSSDPVSWFPEDHSYSISSELLNSRFGGTSALEVIVDTGRVDGLKDPRVMERLDSVETLVEEFRTRGARLTHTSSVVDIVKETHQALNANDPAYYTTPDDRLLLAQELLLFENSGSDDLEKIVDSQFSRARYTIRSQWTDGVFMVPFLEEFRPALAATIGDVAQVEVTGMSALMARTVDAIYESMIKSYGLALCLITPLMILLIGSLRSGLISMVPNLAPILFTLGMMGWLGVPIDMFTLLAGCIAIGLAVDDSIHFISGFRRCYARGATPREAVEETMLTTGRALLFTSIVLTTGFAVLLLSEMLNLRNVGGLTVFAISMAFLLDVTVTPALLVLTHRGRDRRAASA